MIDERIVRNEAAHAALHASVAEGSFACRFPGYSGTLTASRLDERIAQRQQSDRLGAPT